MRVFVSEYLCSGACPTARQTSLLIEGRAMLTALVTDLAAISGCEVVTTWDAALGECPVSNVTALPTGNPGEELKCFEQLIAECDATLVIAPETDGILEARCAAVGQSGGVSLNCSLETITLTSDKLTLAETLTRAGIATVPTARFCEDLSTSFETPRVVKLRDGAGSQEMQVWHPGEQQDLLDHPERFLVQPLLRGTSVSVAVLAGKAEFHALPICQQHISDDGHFHYQGGTLPASLTDRQAIAVQELVESCCAILPGIRGYLGFDLILPEESPESPVIAEINPRLTTSYLGYRHLAQENLAERMAFPGRNWHKPFFAEGVVHFSPSGELTTSVGPSE